MKTLTSQIEVLRLSMRTRINFILTLILFLGLSCPIQAQFSGNPLFTGADPEIHYFNNKYYIYTTAHGGTQFHAYSSVDLTNWKDEGVIFDIVPQCAWADKNGWAPGVAFKNNKYYFYYTAEVKIGVAVGDSPTGPFTDPLGVPLIGTDPFTDDIIDAMVFTDDDGQSYIYYGGSGKSKLSVRKLGANMTSIITEATNITPTSYTEGPFLLKRNGIYYMTYSNGAWYNETYNVRYATSSSPVGPWTYQGVILSSNVEDKGPGHHSIIKIGNCDEYYMIYHRYENGLGGSRVVAIDHMYFNAAGLIDPVNMTNYGVAPRVPDNTCLPAITAPPIISGATYKLVHKGTNQCLDVGNNSGAAGATVQQWVDNGNDAQRWIITLESDGFYKLRHKGTNQCLEVIGNSTTSGTRVHQNTDDGSDGQRWKMEVMTGGYIKFTHKGTNLCLDVIDNSSTSGAKVQQYTDNNTDGQRWQLVLIEDPIVSGGLYKLTHKGTNQCLSVENNSTAARANVNQWTSKGNSNDQLWYITLDTDGYYELKRKGTNMCLDVADNSSAAGANVQQYTDNNTAGQRWKLELQSDGYYKLTHKGTTQCLDVANNLAEPGTNVQQYNDNGNDAQRWKLDLMPDVNPVTGTGVGLQGNYFNGMNFETPVLNRIEDTINFDWVYGSPGTGVNTNQFSARWIGKVQPKYDGEYTFFVTSDNGRRLWVNNQLIIDQFINDVGAYSGKIMLKAGQKYEIKLEYFENSGTASCKLEWSSVLQGREVIPKTQLYLNVPPTISITSPANNAVYTSPATITITATAADADGIVSKVEFYNGTTKLGEDATAPYTYSWANVAAGTYIISAKATDNSGTVTTSSAITVKVNSLPTVSITAPINNAVYVAPATVTITATAIDSDGSIAKVEFYHGAILLGTATTFPYTYNWNNVAVGTYAITAKATDNSGGTTTSSIITVKVNANVAPTVTITAPLNNAAYTAPATVNIAATATDSDGSVTKVEFYNGATLLSTATASPYTYNWTNVAAGTYSITAKATDNSGGTTVASAITVKVNAPNVVPVVSITSPVNNASYTAPASVTITADASDADGTISKVEFYNGTDLLGTSAASPYRFTWVDVAVGNYTITARAIDNSGATTTSSALQVTVNITTGIDDLVVGDGFSIAPNPVHDQLDVKSSEPLTDAYMSITDMTGREVIKGQVTSSGQINVTGLSNGVYFLIIRTEDGRILKEKFIKN